MKYFKVIFLLKKELFQEQCPFQLWLYHLLLILSLNIKVVLLRKFNNKNLVMSVIKEEIKIKKEINL